MPRKPKGTPLQSVQAGDRPSGRAVGWKIRRSERERLATLAEDAESGWLTKHYRARVLAAAAVTPPLPTTPDETVGTSVRFDDEHLAAISRSATAVGLQHAVWLMLMNTEAGDLLLKQLAAGRAASKTKPR